MPFPVILVLLCGYLLGSIPFSFLIGKARGKDIRLIGSRNPGATNVFRSVGPVSGVAAFILDAAKGLAASYALPRVLDGNASLEVLGSLGGVAVVAGHMWPVFLGFKGGKGVATALGVFLGLVPVAAAFSLSLWIAVLVITGYVSVASIAGALSLPLFVAIIGGVEGSSIWPFVFSLAVAVGVVLAHRTNISRLLKGTENRIVRRGGSK
jgi:glycerol-3-phosphate acyltransferase PlsY